MNRKRVKEIVGGEPYEYLPLGKFIVSAPRVCRGRPTFKYTRIEAAGALQRLAAGFSIDNIFESYQGRVSRDAIQEAVFLAAKALSKQKSRAASAQ